MNGEVHKQWTRDWMHISHSFTNLLRWYRCRWIGDGQMIACDTGGWFPLKRLVGQGFSNRQANLDAIINIVDHDDRSRFQISAEVDQWGNVYDYFAIRAVSGHGIP